MDKLEIANRIKEARLAAKLTQAQIAQRLGVTYQTISNYERGINRIDNETLTELCSVLGISVLDILSESQLKTCPICGLSYSPQCVDDIFEHKDFHERWEKAVHKFGTLYDSSTAASEKAVAYDVLYDKTAQYNERYNAAVKLITAYFSRSVIASSLSLEHPDFSTYTAMLLRQRRYSETFGQDVYDTLVKEYGTLAGIPDNMTTYRVSVLSNVSNTAIESEIIKKYRALDEHGTKAVDSILDIEYDRCTSSPKVIPFPESTRVIPYSYIPASAGVGEWLDVENIDEIEIPDTAEYRNADFAVPVAGDSMEPTYSDGDVLLVHEQDAVNIGDIGLFAVNGHGYVKEMGNGVLISHNHEYDDIPIDESFKCFGKVIGKLK